MPCRCEDKESDNGYWDSHIKVLMEQLVAEINNTMPWDYDKIYVKNAWVKAFDHLLNGCPQKK